MIEAVIGSLRGRDYERIARESDLQIQVERRLRLANLEFRSQVQLDASSDRDRVDVLCGSVAIELKTSGVVSTVLAQLERYAQSDLVTELLLVTTRAAHLKLRGLCLLHGKPLYVVHVSSL